MRYSALKILKEGLTGNKGWRPVWREPEPKAEYDIVIVGGGGHGLATAYYLAKEFGQQNVAVVEKYAPTLRLHKTHHHIKSRRFSGTIRSEQTHNLPPVHLNGYPLHHRPATVLLHQIISP